MTHKICCYCWCVSRGHLLWCTWRRPTKVFVVVVLFLAWLWNERQTIKPFSNFIFHFLCCCSVSSQQPDLFFIFWLCWFHTVAGRRNNVAETFCTLHRIVPPTLPPPFFQTLSGEKILQRWQNNCGPEFKEPESQRAELGPCRLTVTSDGWRASRTTQIGGGYLLQQMGFCTFFSTRIHDWKRRTLCVARYQRFWCCVTPRGDNVARNGQTGRWDFSVCGFVFKSLCVCWTNTKT